MDITSLKHKVHTAFKGAAEAVLPVRLKWKVPGSGPVSDALASVAMISIPTVPLAVLGGVAESVFVVALNFSHDVMLGPEIW